VQTKTQKLNLFKKVGLYPVLCPEFARERSLIFILNEIAGSGAEIVQLRMKNNSSKEFFKTAEKFREITSKHNILLIINDRADIAMACKADGVHLGQDDLPPETVAKFAKKLIIGVSTHSPEEALQAEKNGADYINIGPIFSTNTKKNASPVGIEMVEKVKNIVNIPFSVMGGIKTAHIPDLIRAGAMRIAMITEISEAENIREKFSELQKKIR
jgi:thiamine-phosphate pyrophosphorylase